jgi:YD repeat-containing protein
MKEADRYFYINYVKRINRRFKVKGIINIILFIFMAIIQLFSQEIFNEYQMQPEVFHFVHPEYGEVDAKGDLNLQIPVMTVPGRGGMDFPIVFQYHSGIGVDQHASWIGLGWEWDPGSFTRDVKGSVIRDDNVMGVDFPYVQECYPQDEYAHDIYYLHIDGGTIPVYKKYIESSATTNLEPFNLYYTGFWNQWKIDSMGVSIIDVDDHNTRINSGNDHEDYEGFIVTKDDGTRYIFEVPTLAQYIKYLDNGGEPEQISVYVSTWRIRAILAPDYDDLDGTKLIPEDNDDGNWIKFKYKYNVKECSTVVGGHNDEVLTQLKYLYRIVTPTHEAVFETCLREDKDGEVLYEDQWKYPLHRSLKYIKLYSKHDLNNPIQKVELNHGMFGYDERISLGSIFLYGQDNLIPQKYTFDYWLPDTQAEYPSESYQWDDFGYLNTAGSKGWANNFNYDTESAKAWSLKKIVYPTGGSETFYYENDEIDINTSVSFYHWIHQYGGYSASTKYYEITGNNNKQGGLRVKKIVREDGMGGMSDEYIYSYHRFGGKLTAVPPYYFKRGDWWCMNYGGTRGHSSVYYPNITKQNPDGSTIKKIYTIGKEANVFCFSMYHDYNRYSIMQDNNDWDWGTIKEIEYRDNIGYITKKIKNEYDIFSYILSENSWDINYPVKYRLGFKTLTEEKNTVCGSSRNSIDYISRYQYESFNLLRRKTEIGSNGSDEIKRNTRYEFAYEKYPEMKDKNMFSPIAKETVNYFLPLGNDSLYNYSVFAIAMGPVGDEETDTEEFTVSHVTTVNYEYDVDKSEYNQTAYFKIKKNGENYIYIAKTDTGSGSFTASPGYVYTMIAYAKITKNGGDIASSKGEVEYTLSEYDSKYYSSKVTTWKNFEVRPQEIETLDSLWKPYSTYIWNDINPGDSAPSFSAWSSESTPSDERWLLSSTNEEYDDHGHLTKQKDANGNSTCFYYGSNSDNFNNNASGLFNANLTGIEKGNLKLEIDYHSTIGKVSKITDANGNSIYYNYDDFGRLKDIKNNNNSELLNSYEYYYSHDGNNGNFNAEDPNSIKTKAYRSVNDYTISTSYFDGLVKNIQNQVQVDANDIITAIDYDELDRPIKNWKPYIDNLSNHQYQPNYSINANNYFSASGPGIDAGGYPFTEINYFSGLLDRVKYKFPPGDDFHNNHYLKYKYHPNIENEITGYAERTLWRTLSIDENENAVDIFQDQLGRKIVQRQLYLDDNNIEQNHGRIIATAFPSNNTYNMYEEDIYCIDNTIEQYIRYEWESYIYNIEGKNYFKIEEVSTNSSIVSLEKTVNDVVIDSFLAELGKSYRFTVIAECSTEYNDESNNSDNICKIMESGDIARSEADIYYNDIEYKSLATTKFENDILGNVTKVYPPNYFDPPRRLRFH